MMKAAVIGFGTISGTHIKAIAANDGMELAAICDIKEELASKVPEGVAFYTDYRQMCQEIKDALIEIDYLDKYRITQIKEKYGMLRWYDFGGSRKIYDIISKYEGISQVTCICCGKPATKITTGWISPYCDDCVPTYEGEPFQTVPIEEYYDSSDDSEND